jgi:hypothetical protein
MKIDITSHDASCIEYALQCQRDRLADDARKGYAKNDPFASYYQAHAEHCELLRVAIMTARCKEYAGHEMGRTDWKFAA